MHSIQFNKMYNILLKRTTPYEFLRFFFLKGKVSMYFSTSMAEGSLHYNSHLSIGRIILWLSHNRYVY